MQTILQLGEIEVDVVRKDIKNLHLSVYPPTGRVRIAAPIRMKLDTIRIYAISKLGWIKKKQKKLLSQEREPPRDYIERESHYVWGKRYLMAVVEHDAAPVVALKHRKLVLAVRPGTLAEKRQSVLEAWYRQELKAAAAPLIAKWEKRLGVKVAQLFVQRMKTKWAGPTRERVTSA